MSAVDLPPFDRSAMDGYAVRAADTDPPRRCASPARSPRARSRAARSRPGPRSGSPPAPRCPPGADAILRVEDARVDGDRVTPAGPRRAPGLHVRYRGEDVARGDVLAPAGARARRRSA